MFWDARIKCEKMGINYLDNILEQAASWKIDYLEKEKKGDVIEITTTYGWPTARLVVEDDKVTFYFNYQPFEYKRLIDDKKIIKQIKQAIK